ncbi:hypothetical protein BP6252_03014 [Coleophoma cylindrospora]|uniref:Uncharacterized protein n=1 Tax=Coleophoma cylindrospora TaxID=1849047 RepID=A0A3D8S6I7_9HELO|nr:hypothetical protein BP6252_03014 [Coleophoma cylindrospora]
MAPKSLRKLPGTLSKSVGKKAKAVRQSVIGIFGGKDSGDTGSLVPVPRIPLPPAPDHGILTNGSNRSVNQTGLSLNATAGVDENIPPMPECNACDNAANIAYANDAAPDSEEGLTPVLPKTTGINSSEHSSSASISRDQHSSHGTNAADMPNSQSEPNTRLASDATAVDNDDQIEPAPAQEPSANTDAKFSDVDASAHENYKQDYPCKSGHPVYMADTLTFYYFWECLRWYHQDPNHGMVGTENRIFSSVELMQNLELGKDRLPFSDEQIDLALRREEKSFLYRHDHGSWLTQRRCDLLNYINRLTIVDGALSFPSVPGDYIYEVIDSDYFGDIGKFLSKIPKNGGPFNGLHDHRKSPDGRSGINPFRRRLQHCILPTFRSGQKLTTPTWHFEHRKADPLAHTHQKADFAVYCFRDSDPETYPHGNSGRPKSTDRFRVVAAVFGGGEGHSATVRGENQFNAGLPPTFTIEAAIPRHIYDANIITKRPTLSWKPWTPSILDAMLALKEASLQYNASGQAFNLDTVGKFSGLEIGDSGFPGNFTMEEVTYALNSQQRGNDIEKLSHDHQTDCTGFQLLRSRMRPIVTAAGQVMAGIDEQQAKQSTELLTAQHLQVQQKQLREAATNGQDDSSEVVGAAMNMPPASTGAQTQPPAGDKNDEVNLGARSRRLRNLLSRSGRRASSAH